MQYNKEKYMRCILEYGAKPRNYGTLANASIVLSKSNVLCGDYINLYLSEAMNRDSEHNKVVSDARFDGDGCALMKASASMMTGLIKDRDLDYVEKLLETFENITRGNNRTDRHDVDTADLDVFQGIAAYRSRQKCVDLPWSALRDYVGNHKARRLDGLEG